METAELGSDARALFVKTLEMAGVNLAQLTAYYSRRDLKLPIEGCTDRTIPTALRGTSKSTESFGA